MYVFHQICKVFGHYSFTYFFRPFSSSPSAISIMHMLACLLVSQVSIRFCSFFYIFFFYFIILRMYELYWCNFKFTVSLFCQLKSAVVPHLVDFSFQLLFFSNLAFPFGLIYISLFVFSIYDLLLSHIFHHLYWYIVSFISLNMVL